MRGGLPPSHTEQSQSAQIHPSPVTKLHGGLHALLRVHDDHSESAAISRRGVSTGRQTDRAAPLSAPTPTGVRSRYWPRRSTPYAGPAPGRVCSQPGAGRSVGWRSGGRLRIGRLEKTGPYPLGRPGLLKRGVPLADGQRGEGLRGGPQVHPWPVWTGRRAGCRYDPGDLTRIEVSCGSGDDADQDDPAGVPGGNGHGARTAPGLVAGAVAGYLQDARRSEGDVVGPGGQPGREGA